MKVSVIGAGTMGAGIAQIAATKGHEVCLYDSFDGAVETDHPKVVGPDRIVALVHDKPDDGSGPKESAQKNGRSQKTTSFGRHGCAQTRNVSKCRHAERLGVAEKGVGKRQPSRAGRSHPGNAEQEPGERLGGNGAPQVDQAAFHNNTRQPQIQDERSEPEGQKRTPSHAGVVKPQD